MIFRLFDFFKKHQINFCVLNGYEDILSGRKGEFDVDILFKKEDFIQIETLLKLFCKEEGFKLVQIYHQKVYAKNIFLYHSALKELLNLDLYGELKIKKVPLFPEKEIFRSIRNHKGIPVLSYEKEFIYYLIKKLVKGDLTEKNFIYLKKIFDKNMLAREALTSFFSEKGNEAVVFFEQNNRNGLVKKSKKLLAEFYKRRKTDIYCEILEKFRELKRIRKPTGLSISFLGPDGSGKSTIIEDLVSRQLPFRKKVYFHLKPLKAKNQKDQEQVTDPHKHKPYSKGKSYLKLFYFLVQYNYGWCKNIIPLRIKSSLVIFDRYFDDLLADNRRYLYSGRDSFARFIRKFIPKPDIYFILTTDPEIIYTRKKEVFFEELKKQIARYNALADNKRYFILDVNNQPEKITDEVVEILMAKMNERY